MPQIHMRLDDGRHHLHFWCNTYHPYQFYYPKNKYQKGEKPCIHCCIAQDGFLYRAPYQCEREGTSAIAKQQIKELFGWLYGGEIKAERKHAKKTVKASKERTDIHGTEEGTPTRVFYENPVAEKLGEPEAQVGTSGIKQGLEFTFGSIPPIANGMPKVSEGTVRDNNTPVHGTIPDETVPEMRSADNVQSDRKQPVACVRAVFEPAMKEEYDPSYKETTAHACITCKCGTKVWYGCAKRHLTRPKYCASCTRGETVKIASRYEGTVDAAELQRIMDWELRRVITR